MGRRNERWAVRGWLGSLLLVGATKDGAEAARGGVVAGLFLNRALRRLRSRGREDTGGGEAAGEELGEASLAFFCSSPAGTAGSMEVLEKKQRRLWTLAAGRDRVCSI